MEQASACNGDNLVAAISITLNRCQSPHAIERRRPKLLASFYETICLAKRMISSRRFKTAVLVAFVSCLSEHAFACSKIACLDRGIELNRNFVMSLRYHRKPLAGAQVHITGSAAMDAVTQDDGTARFTGLAPGDYWLSVQFLGIIAANECFHVTARNDRTAQRSIHFNWGDEPTAIRAITGVLLDSQRGSGGSLIWNISHPVKVPIADAIVALENPVSREVLRTSSDAKGAFAFNSARRGTYVLHIESGSSGHVFAPTDILIRVTRSAHKNAMTLVRTEPSGGSCGDTSLQLR